MCTKFVVKHKAFCFSAQLPDLCRHPKRIRIRLATGGLAKQLGRDGDPKGLRRIDQCLGVHVFMKQHEAVKIQGCVIGLQVLGQRGQQRQRFVQHRLEVGPNCSQIWQREAPARGMRYLAGVVQRIGVQHS